MQWFFEDGATAFVRAAQSSDTELMKLLLEYQRGSVARDRATVTPRSPPAGGIGWVEGVTYERSPQENVEALRMLLGLGLDPNGANSEGRTRADGRGAEGAQRAPIQLLVDRGAKLDQHDRGSRDTDKIGSAAAGTRGRRSTTLEGLVRVRRAVRHSASPRPRRSFARLLMERGPSRSTGEPQHSLNLRRLHSANKLGGIYEKLDC